MMRTSPALLALVLVACGGSTEPAESPASAAPAADAPTSEAPTPGATPAAGTTDEAGWEGEDEAKKSAADSSGPSGAGTGKPAPPDTNKQETRTVDVIAKIVKDNRQPVRDCYDKAQKQLPSLKGDMVIFFVLDPEGKVKKIELNQQASTLKSPEVVDCAIKVIKGLNFPPSSRGMETTVNYPYNFNPK
jgi:hypothetical protein